MLSKQNARSMTIWLALVLTSAVAGCNDGQKTIEVTPSVDSFCLTQKPVRRTRAEIAALPQAQVDADLAHNEFGARRCGWKP